MVDSGCVGAARGIPEVSGNRSENDRDRRQGEPIMARTMSLATRNTSAVIGSLRQYGERAKERAKVVVEESADRAYQTARQNAPVDTGFMVEHLRREFTPAGLGYSVGFRAEDFAAAGKDFYPLYVI